MIYYYIVLVIKYPIPFINYIVAKIQMPVHKFIVKGSKIPKTRAWVDGASVFTVLFSSFRISVPSFARSKKFSEKSAGGFQQAGKKEGGLVEMNFCLPAVPRSGTEGGKRFRNSALAEYQNRKIFVSLTPLEIEYVVCLRFTK